MFIWGCHKNGRLGFDSNEEIKKPVKIEDLSPLEIIDVSCGALHTLVSTIEGKVLSFGHGKNGKLGDGEENDSCFPVKVTFPLKTTKIAR